MLRPGTFALTALLAGLTAIGPLSTDMYLPSLPEIADVLKASTSQVQLTISAYLVGFALGQIFYGPVSDRHGRKPILLAALGIFCLASLMCALATSIEMLIVARFLQAIGGCGGVVLARAIVRDLYAGARAGRELSLISSVMALAPVVAPLIGGVLQTGFGWRFSFLVLVAAGVIVVLIIWARLPETLRERAAEPVSPASILRSYRIFLRDRGYLAYAGLVMFTYAGLFAWISGASFVLQNLYGLSPFAFGVAFALGSIGFMAGSAIAARLLGRIGIGGVTGYGCIALTAGGLLMVASVALGLSSAAALVIPASIYLVGLGLVLPPSVAGAMTPFPGRAGAASSLLGFAQQSSAALCGVAVGLLLGQTAWPMAGGIASMGCGALLLWILTRDARSHVAH